MVMTGEVITASTGVSGAARKAIRRVMSRSVRMPIGRSDASRTIAHESLSLARLLNHLGAARIRPNHENVGSWPGEVPHQHGEHRGTRTTTCVASGGLHVSRSSAKGNYLEVTLAENEG